MGLLKILEVILILVITCLVLVIGINIWLTWQIYDLLISVLQALAIMPKFL